MEKALWYSSSHIIINSAVLYTDALSPGQRPFGLRFRASGGSFVAEGFPGWKVHDWPRLQEFRVGLGFGLGLSIERPRRSQLQF